MLNVVIVAIIVGTAIWVYLDATKNKIGKVKDAGGMFNMSAGAWSVVTLLLWIIGFPAYLIGCGFHAGRFSLFLLQKAAEIAVNR